MSESTPYDILFGAVDCSTVPVTANLVASHVGIKMMGLAMGLISAGHAIGVFAGGWGRTNEALVVANSSITKHCGSHSLLAVLLVADPLIH